METTGTLLSTLGLGFSFTFSRQFLARGHTDDKMITTELLIFNLTKCLYILSVHCSIRQQCVGAAACLQNIYTERTNNEECGATNKAQAAAVEFSVSVSHCEWSQFSVCVCVAFSVV